MSTLSLSILVISTVISVDFVDFGLSCYRAGSSSLEFRILSGFVPSSYEHNKYCDRRWCGYRGRMANAWKFKDIVCTSKKNKNETNSNCK